jgi:hypothetical protein
MTVGNPLTAIKLSADEEQEVTQLYEERADHLELETIKSNTVLSEESDRWLQSLTGTGAKLLVGPRGCGKTHLMRFAFTECVKDPSAAFAVYTNLNRYYHLEPALRKRPDAMTMFYVWVLANIAVGLDDALRAYGGANFEPEAITGMPIAKIRELIGAYEQLRTPSAEQDALAARLTIDHVKGLLLKAAESFHRRRVVLFLDDAALTLTPEFLSNFFDIFRALKGSKIAPKASVYPGSTEYGPNFHATHEAESIFVWKSVIDSDYLTFMETIGNTRFPDMNAIPAEVRGLLAYAAFGVPRAFMTLVRLYKKHRDTSSNAQVAFNKTIDDFVGEKRVEYMTLRDKKPQFASIVAAGREALDGMLGAVTAANQELAEGTTRQLTIGIDNSTIEHRPYVDRMLRLLEEAGMIYKRGNVSHGQKEYLRLVPHVGALIQDRAFARKRGFSAAFALEMLQRQDEKQPVRRVMTALLGAQKLDDLGLDLPNCKSCNAKRAEGAKFCSECGTRLTDESTYDRLLLTKLSQVPGLTQWQRDKLSNTPGIPRTVGEFLALQDPGTLLRTIRHVGRRRAETIIDAVVSFLDEYLS